AEVEHHVVEALVGIEADADPPERAQLLLTGRLALYRDVALELLEQRALEVFEFDASAGAPPAAMREAADHPRHVRPEPDAARFVERVRKRVVAKPERRRIRVNGR